jgi:cytidine deaminase
MDARTLTDADWELIEAAKETIRDVYVPGTGPTSRSVGAALRTSSGAVYTGVNLTTATPRASVCAEPIAVGRAVTDGETAFDTIVAVKHALGADPRADADGDGAVVADVGDDAVVISACGVCRELLRDYDPSTLVVVPGADGPEKVPVETLLPAVHWRAGGPPDEDEHADQTG